MLVHFRLYDTVINNDLLLKQGKVYIALQSDWPGIHHRFSSVEVPRKYISD